MDFDKWFKDEGSLMSAAGCRSEIIAEAAWQAATHEGFVAGFLCAGGELEEAKDQAQQFIDCTQ
jgi:hypothetical protein